MNRDLLSAEGSSELSFPSANVPWARRKHNVRSLVIALLLLASLFTFVVTMLLHYPEKVDAFLNSDEPAESKHVVTGNH